MPPGPSAEAPSPTGATVMRSTERRIPEGRVLLCPIHGFASWLTTVGTPELEPLFDMLRYRVGWPCSVNTGFSRREFKVGLGVGVELINCCKRKY